MTGASYTQMLKAGPSAAGGLIAQQAKAPLPAKKKIPVWVFIAAGVVLLAIIGLITFMVMSKKPG